MASSRQQDGHGDHLVRPIFFAILAHPKTDVNKVNDKGKTALPLVVRERGWYTAVAEIFENERIIICENK
jgi:hypothetical protein